MVSHSIKRYRCACGCDVTKEGIKRVMRDGRYSYCCKEHNHGDVVSKYGICIDCGDEYNIPLSSNVTNLARCAECDDGRHNDDMTLDKSRKWDCWNYESCLWENRLEKSFNCTACSHYAKERKQIDLVRTNDNCVDDYYSKGRSNPGGGTN